MTEDIYRKIYDLETTPEALSATADYIAARMKPFLQTLEPVLICFPDEGPASLGGVFREAVLRCDATPIFWGPDYRWKELLRMAFDTHANTIIGHPQVVLGLMKIARATATPLYIYDVIVGGDPFPHWMVDGLKKGLDCMVWGCYAVRSGPMVAGFSCEQEAGIHIREDVFTTQVVRGADTAGKANRGRLYFESAKNPELVYDPEQIALVQYQPCSCGCDAPRVVDTNSARESSLLLHQLEEKLLTWSSVLDYRAEYTESGAALELVVFPGESIPQLPSFAKLRVRQWNPQTDVPFCMMGNSGEIPEKTVE